MDDTLKIRNKIWNTQILFKKGKIQNNRICTESNGLLKNENCMHRLHNLLWNPFIMLPLVLFDI